jgi:predicted permease
VSIAREPLSLDVARFVAVGVACTLSGAALGYLARPPLRPQPRAFAPAVQRAFRFNFFLALAPAAALGGTAGGGLMSLLIGTAVPLCNVLSVWGLARGGGQRAPRELVRTPPILATLGGFLVALSSLIPTVPLAVTLNRLGHAAVPLGRIAVGTDPRLLGAREAPGLAASMVTVKLLSLPAVTLGLATLAGLPSLQTQVAVLFAGPPSASSSYILAVRKGGNGPRVAFVVSAATIGATVTLPCWLSLAI